MLANCSGNVGAKSFATVTPSGCTSARYSPLALRLKLACSGAPGTARFLPEAKTMMNPLGARLIAGKRHLVRLAALSVRNQPFRFTLVVPELKTSIQSGVAPSSSAKPPLFEARNSEMKTGSAAAAARSPPRISRTTHIQPAAGIRKQRNMFMQWAAQDSARRKRYAGWCCGVGQ